MNNKIKVLVADDNVAIGMIICEFLENQATLKLQQESKMEKMPLK